jgi:hypothetical protein
MERPENHTRRVFFAPEKFLSKNSKQNLSEFLHMNYGIHSETTPGLKETVSIKKRQVTSQVSLMDRPGESNNYGPIGGRTTAPIKLNANPRLVPTKNFGGLKKPIAQF